MFLVSKNMCCSFVFLDYFYCSLTSLSHEYLGIIWSSVAEPRLPHQGFVKMGPPRARNSPFMASNLPPLMLLESFDTVFYILIQVPHPPPQVYYSRPLVRWWCYSLRMDGLMCRKWMAFAWSCTVAHLGGWGPVQSQPLTKVLPVPYPLSYYYYYY